ncbi:MAG: hypothetical protein BGO47_02365 [Microbacterium sp. 67-17]|uniref:hypothetical protein n=1 Tax=Microbacterium sp. 67-17 TaxID=1895782 RepID=UPI00096142E3|nr:hypothetical protein [Microbacterium sp. 67-17]OJW00661.1 MAG: hypothetical protein BGO47_02365 [Microbacterium sp. 67-17]
MTDTDTQASVAGNSVLPGVEIVAAIRRVATVAALALLAYMTFTRGSAGTCVGGVGADGGYIDANGDPTDVAPQCISLALEPSPVVIIAVVLTFIVALTLVIRRAQTVPPCASGWGETPALLTFALHGARTDQY